MHIIHFASAYKAIAALGALAIAIDKQLIYAQELYAYLFMFKYAALQSMRIRGGNRL